MLLFFSCPVIEDKLRSGKRKAKSKKHLLAKKRFFAGDDGVRKFVVYFVFRTMAQVAAPLISINIFHMSLIYSPVL